MTCKPQFRLDSNRPEVALDDQCISLLGDARAKSAICCRATHHIGACVWAYCLQYPSIKLRCCAVKLNLFRIRYNHYRHDG